MQTPELTNNAEFPPPASTRPFVQGAPDGPALSAAVQRDLLKYMMMTREVDDRIEKKLYRQGKIVGGVYTGRGQEAISVAFTLALQAKDYIIPSHRDMGVYVTRGMSLYKIFAQYLGRKDGPARGKDGNMHMGDLQARPRVVRVDARRQRSRSSRARASPTATARSRASRSRSTARARPRAATGTRASTSPRCRRPTACSSSTTTRTPTRRRPTAQYAAENLADRAIGYGIPGYVIDGNDAEAVYRTAIEVCERARTGGGPSIVECKTFRMTGHSAHDDPSHYVPPEKFPEWEKKDPIARLSKRLLDAGVVDRAWLDADRRPRSRPRSTPPSSRPRPARSRIRPRRRPTSTTTRRGRS